MKDNIPGAVMFVVVSLIMAICDGDAIYIGVGFFSAVCAILIGYFKDLRSEREAEAQKTKKLEGQRKQEQEEKTLAHMVGLEKFHQMDVDDARRYQEGIVAMRQLGVIMQQSVYQEKKKDWAILGGIAEGIAGPAAGIITAANAINDNAKIEANNAARREWGVKQNAFYQNLASQAEQKRKTALSMKELQEKYMAVLSWKPSTLFSLIKFSGTKADVDAQTGAVFVSTSWKQEDKSICIDGALRAKLYTGSGQCAGCAYLVMPKVGTVGFEGKLTGICASPIKKATHYSVKIEPVDLWELALKENATFRRTDNLTDSAHRKLVTDYEVKFRAELK